MQKEVKKLDAAPMQGVFFQFNIFIVENWRKMETENQVWNMDLSSFQLNSLENVS